MRRGLAAVMAFEMAQRLLPDREDAFLACGEALGSLGRYQAAVTSFEQAVRINPRSVDAFKGMAAAYEALGAREAASLCTQKIRELNDTPTLH
jgi:cytochrome c-type biogenesis protein CcmH/NrfG